MEKQPAVLSEVDTGIVRKFETGATRDTSQGKYDYEAFLSPIVLERYAAYLHEHRKQSDGSFRDGDNWQKGIPLPVYMKSLWRHLMDMWKLYRGYSVTDLKTKEPVNIEDAACGILFNTMGFLFETLKKKEKNGNV